MRFLLIGCRQQLRFSEVGYSLKVLICFFGMENAWMLKQQRQQTAPQGPQRNNLFFCRVFFQLVKFWWVFFFFDLVVVVVFKPWFSNRPFTTVQQRFHKDTRPCRAHGTLFPGLRVYPMERPWRMIFMDAPVGFAPWIGPKKVLVSFKMFDFFSDKICRGRCCFWCLRFFFWIS